MECWLIESPRKEQAVCQLCLGKLHKKITKRLVYLKKENQMLIFNSDLAN